MATRRTSRTNVVGISSITFIRAMSVKFYIKNAKPSVKLYAFFDGVSVDKYITPSELVTDANGSVSGTFDIPAMTFNTGVRVLRFQDVPTLTTDVAGSLISSAQAEFTTTAIKRTLQETVTNITVLEPPPPPPATDWSPQDSGGSGGSGDPLAQTFFTYGITGGCYVPKIDIYFQSKDDNIPVTLQIRNVENGYPGKTLVSKFADKTLNPSQVNISKDASVATSFVFDSPVYLEEDKDYCFVLLSNCNTYHVWTSKLGEKSIETGKTVFDQPFIGTLFKSENNITWTAEQTEDIKFTIYKAKFNTAATGNAVFVAKSEPILVNGENFTVTNNSSTVTVKFDHKHGLTSATSSITLSALSGAVYRGIPAADLTGDFSVTATDEYTVQFTAKNSSTAVVTGSDNKLTSIGFVKDILIDAGGTGYSVGDALTFSGGSPTTTATAVVSAVSNGAITKINITNGGAGYVSAPTVTATTGSGAELVAITEAIFGVTTNRLIHNYLPTILNKVVTDTKIKTVLSPVLKDYDTKNSYDIFLNKENVIGKTGWLVSKINDDNLAGGVGTYYTKISNTLSTTNENTSPAIYLNDTSRLLGVNYIINSKTAIGTSELTANSGLAEARYVTKPITLATTSVGARIFVSAYSANQSGFDLYIRTTLSGSGVTHKEQSWKLMKCDVDRNKSTKPGEFKDYTFYIDSLDPFDVYDLKIVMYSDDAAIVPIIENYRVIILAS